MEYDPGVISDAIKKELRRGGQVYYLHNDVASIERVAAGIRERVPEARIGIGHGKMSSYFVAGFGGFASSSPQRTFKTSSKTVSGALPPSATLMYGRLPAESITLFGMP